MPFFSLRKLCPIRIHVHIHSNTTYHFNFNILKPFQSIILIGLFRCRHPLAGTSADERGAEVKQPLFLNIPSSFSFCLFFATSLYSLPSNFPTRTLFPPSPRNNPLADKEQKGPFRYYALRDHSDGEVAFQTALPPSLEGKIPPKEFEDSIAGINR